MRGFGGLLRGSVRRDLGPLLVSGLGIMVGVAALVFFLRLGLGAKEHIFEDLMGQLPVGTLELKAEKGTALLGFLTGSKAQGMGPTIAAPHLEELRGLPAVKTVHERLRVDFPMIAWGLQKELRLPKPMAVDVFASGLPEAYVAKDVSEGYEFVDPGKGKPIPVLVSKRLVAMANSALAATLRIELTPKLISGLTYNVQLGRSFMTGSRKDPRARVVTCQVVGGRIAPPPWGSRCRRRWRRAGTRSSGARRARSRPLGWSSPSRSAWARWSPRRAPWAWRSMRASAWWRWRSTPP